MFLGYLAYSGDDFFGKFQEDINIRDPVKDTDPGNGLREDIKIWA
jgi:hypothetical protein